MGYEYVARQKPTSVARHSRSIFARSFDFGDYSDRRL